MKKSVFYLAALTAVLAVACQKEKDPSNDNVNPPAKEGLIFKATTPSVQTRTSISDGEGNTKIVSWVANDQIEVWWDDDAHVTYATAEAGTESEFTPVSDPVDYVQQYYASYPASAVTALDAENGALSVSVPAEQGYGKTVDGTFAKANIAVSTTSRVYLGLAFKNVTALVKFTVTGSDYTKAVFKGAKGETVAGSVSVTFDAENDNEPVFGDVSDGSTDITVTLNGAGEYYFSVLPQTFDGGFSVTLYKGETAGAPAYVRNSKEMSRSTLWDLGTLDGVGVKDFFVTPAGAGKKSGKSWNNAFGAAELKAFIEQPVDGEGNQIDDQDYYKAEILDGATFHMAAGDYYLAGEAGSRVKVEFTGYDHPVAVTFKGGYSTGRTGTDVSGWTMPTAGETAPTYCTAFTGNSEAGVIKFGNQTSITFKGISFKDADLTSFSANTAAVMVEAGSTGNSTLTLSYCRVLNNVNSNSYSGAGIFVGKGIASIDHCYYGGNQAKNGAAINLGSGAGTVTISDCLFKGNTTFNTSGALQNGGKTLTVTDCTFDGNTAGSYGGGAFHTNGDGANTTFTDCVFTGNSAPQGGAVSVQVAEATFTGCSFTNNTATNGSKKAAQDDNPDVLASQAGGAIILHNANAVCTLNNCTFTGNSAPNGNGGAIAFDGDIAATLNINAGTSFSNCTAYNLGGVIFTKKGKLNITGTSDSKVTFSGCKTLATGNQHANGGAIWLGDDSSTSIAYATFTNNEAGQEDGSTVNYSNGGAIRARKVTSLKVNDSEFSGSRGRNGMCLSLELAAASVCEFTNCNFHDNIGRSGASKSGTGGNFHGGVAQLGDNGTVKFEGCAFTDNVAYHGSGAIHQNGANTTVNCKNCTFTHNTAIDGNGGCVTIEKTGTLNAEDCTFTNNSVPATSSTRREGGVFYMSVAGSALTAKGCTFTGNTITGVADQKPFGGILRVQDNSSISFTDCVFDGNGSTSVYSGGCISLNQNAVLKLDNCLFKNNVSKTRGAAIQGGTSALVYMNDVTFYNNTTTASGGWGVNTHFGNANACMNNVTSIGNHCTNGNPGNCVSFNGDGGWLVVNSTIIDSTPTGVVRVGGNNRVSVFCNNVLINTNTANNTWNMKATTNFSSKGHNVISTGGTYNNAAPDANDLLSQTSLPSGAYSEHWSETPHYAVYTWSGSLSGFSAATQSDVTAAIEAYTETDSVHTGITSIGADFKAWLESLETGSYSKDGRGVTRTGTWWPGAYQNN